ncbi:MAG: SDR family oxidoreductase [Mariprofundales bacterium]|nr:SDR family oxidoreductase [Mariprofundales bacterium]
MATQPVSAPSGGVKLPSPLLILGCGFVGSHLARRAVAEGVRVLATARDSAGVARLREIGVEVVADTPDAIDETLLASCCAIVDSIPLVRSGDGWSPPQLGWVEYLVASSPHLRWVGYLSSTSVYADAQGAWVDEVSATLAQSGRGLQRLRAERCWQEATAVVEIFRLSGIYGPGRNLIARLQQGDYRAVVWNPPHFSNRIHVDDIVSALLAAMAAPQRGRVVNVSDDLPLPHMQYVQELAQLTGCAPPLLLSAEEAEERCSAGYLAFFQDNKRISNRRLHRELLPVLRYPSFRSAVSTLMADV